MTINSKQNCVQDLITSLTRTANWRRALQTKFPNGPATGEPPKESISWQRKAIYGAVKQCRSRSNRSLYLHGGATSPRLLTETLPNSFRVFTHRLVGKADEDRNRDDQ